MLNTIYFEVNNLIIDEQYLKKQYNKYVTLRV